MKIKIWMITLLAVNFSLSLSAQNTPEHLKVSSKFELGNGLKFNFNEGDYLFGIGGMMQPYFGVEMPESEETNFYMNSKRTYFHLSGKAVKEKVEFFLQTDFSLGTPLLDAWLAYHPIKNMDITIGQKQGIANNREMLLMEDRLQFADRSILSGGFSNTGREFGVIVSNRFEISKMLLATHLSATSGDGRNSFGVDSRDIDLGGFKYAARVDLYPFGNFTEGNEKQIADLTHETKLKLVLGAAASVNDGASNQVGEGHGDFFLYNANGKNQLPDYRQLVGDILVKWKGFSLLGEYTIGTATGLQGAFTDALSTVKLVPTQISEYLILGSGYNAQLGYVTKTGYGFDFRYAATTPEFMENTQSLLTDSKAWSLGLTKYVKGNSLKLHLGISNVSVGENNTMLAEFLTQVVF